MLFYYHKISTQIVMHILNTYFYFMYYRKSPVGYQMCTHTKGRRQGQLIKDFGFFFFFNCMLDGGITLLLQTNPSLFRKHVDIQF